MKRGNKPTPQEVYIIRGRPTVAFVPDPNLAGRWLRVHPCVALKACPACDVPAGVPCRSNRIASSELHPSKVTVDTHWVRRKGTKIPKSFTPRVIDGKEER